MDTHNKVSIIIVNYNMPESTDNLVDFLKDKVKLDSNIFVVDNGSDREPLSRNTTIQIPVNINKLGGVLAGLSFAALIHPTHYWIISTSMAFEPFEGDPAKELIDQLTSVPNAVAIIPGFVGDLKHATHVAVKANDESKCHPIKLGVGPYSLFDAEWLDSIGRFDRNLTSSWGVDYELGYIAKTQEKVMLVSDTVRVRVDESGKYYEDIDKYQQACREEMNAVFSRKYGPDWRCILGVEDQLCQN